MQALSAVAMFLQDNGTLAADVHSLVTAEWIIAGFCILLLVCLVVAAIVVLVIVGKVKKQINDLTRTVEAKAQPLLSKGQEIMGHTNEIIADLKPKIARVTSDLQPKIASVTSDVQHISSLVRAKVDEAGQTFTQVNSTVQDVNAKGKAQVQRVNGMVSEALTATEQVSRSVQHGIKVPIQKIAEWVAAAKGGIETLVDKMPWAQHVVPKRPGPSATPGRPVPVPTSTARQPGTAAPGGPPFVPGPDYPRR